MKAPSKSMLRLDAVLQGILLIPMFFCYFLSLIESDSAYGILGLILQFFLGGLQLLSGLLRSIQHGSKIRQKYLMVAVPYVLMLIAGVQLGKGSYYGMLVLPTIVIIPCLIAIWYWGLTILQSNGKFEENATANTTAMEKILDEGSKDDLLIDDILQRHQNRIKQSR